MGSLWEKEFVTVDVENDETPRSIVQEQCTALASLTKNRIIARISEYEGETHSYATISPLLKVSTNLLESKFDVQTVLGEVENGNDMAFEFYITCNTMPKYKFRAFIMYHGIMMYPVNFSIERAIADEIEVDAEIAVDNEEELKALLAKILNSNRMTKIINNLLRLSD